MKHRKLFPSPTEPTNSTTECTDDFCDPSCSDKCYPYSDFFFLPPPLPSPSSPPRLFHLLSLNYVIIIAALLASFMFLFVCYYMIIAKSCPGWCSLRNRRRPPPLEDSSDDDEEEEEEFIEDHNQVDHHVWFIATTGLQQSVINSIAVCKYKRGEGLIEGTECSVCLREFQQDDTLRLLPKCSHAFHISCIDTWLRSHTNCPLCRARIVGESISTTSLVPVDQNPDTLMDEDSHIECDLGNARDTNEGDEDRTASERLTEILRPDDDERNPSKDVANSNGNRDAQVTIDLDLLAASNYSQPMSRSLLIDSVEAASMFLVKTDHSSSASEGSSVAMSESAENTITTSSTDGDESSSLGSSSTLQQCLQISPVVMQRSVSCGGRFFVSRQNRSLNSVLPL